VAKPPPPKRTSSSSGYKTVGKTYDGVKVLAPKTKSKTFTAAEVRLAIKRAVSEASSSGDQPLRESDALRVKKRDDGRYEVKKKGAKRASAVKDTQAQAIERAKELDPGRSPIAKRVRKTPGAKKGTWRET
jgi:DNA-binding helix-hairpin-helix protein with protein kinase domain